MAKRKILIVDDDPQIRTILTRMLEGEYEVFHAVDGPQALLSTPEIQPDLVILDIMMPGLSGIEVCQRLRQDFPKERLQILMLSAKDSQADRRRALEYGGDDYVTKPFHLSSLVRKIHYMLEKKEEMAKAGSESRI